MIGSYAKSVWGGSLESAQNRLMLGIENLALAKKLKGDQGWGPWTTAGYKDEKGHINDVVKRSSPVPGGSGSKDDEKKNAMGNVFAYSNGGLVTKPHLGLIGDTGPEVNLPLHDPRAMNMMRKAFDTSEKTKGRWNRHAATGEAILSGKWADWSTGTNPDKQIEQALDKAQNKVDSALEQAFERVGDKLDNRIKELIQKEMDLSDANAEKFMRAGMKMMMELLQHPHIGGDIVNDHISRDVEFETQLKKR
jgi:hypothetical protein